MFLFIREVDSVFVIEKQKPNVYLHMLDTLRTSMDVLSVDLHVCMNRCSLRPIVFVLRVHSVLFIAFEFWCIPLPSSQQKYR